jgi:hypothetical protein
VQGSVAKSTHTEIPWLRYIRQRLGERVHFWPFDGWDTPARRSAVAEVCPIPHLRRHGWRNVKCCAAVENCFGRCGDGRL